MHRRQPAGCACEPVPPPLRSASTTSTSNRPPSTSYNGNRSTEPTSMRADVVAVAPAVPTNVRRRARRSGSRTMRGRSKAGRDGRADRAGGGRRPGASGVRADVASRDRLRYVRPIRASTQRSRRHTRALARPRHASRGPAAKQDQVRASEDPILIRNCCPTLSDSDTHRHRSRTKSTRPCSRPERSSSSLAPPIGDHRATISALPGNVKPRNRQSH